MMLQRAFSNLSILILGLVGTSMHTAHAQSERTINAIPADNHHIHAEQEIKLTPGNNAISVISNVPITVGKYSDAGTFLWGEQPVLENWAKVVVTSDCDTDATTGPVLPTISYSQQGGGEISIQLDGVDDAQGSVMKWLNPSSYSAVWSVMNQFCGSNPWGTPGTGPTIIDSIEPSAGDKCTLFPGVADTFCGANRFCQVKPGQCKRMNVRNLQEGIPEGMPEQAMPVDAMPVDAMPVDAMPVDAMPIIDFGGGGMDIPAMPAPGFDQLPEGVVGYCLDRPQVCIEIYQPVCGCDGFDYDNSCKAEEAGTNVDREGTCDGLDPIDNTGEECPDGQCLNPGGQCALAVRCEADPCMFTKCAAGETCTSNYCGGCNPVCTSTDAAIAVPITCEADGDCTGENEFCQKDMGKSDGVTISSPALTGACMVKPEVCDKMYDPACGVDRVTHSNKCTAWSKGVNVAYKGECTKIVEPDPVEGVACVVVPNAADSFAGASTSSCADGEFCMTAPGLCGSQGSCSAKPDFCNEMYDPVCGCDGETYGNSCAASSNSVGVASEGECGTTLPNGQKMTTQAPPTTTQSSGESITSATTVITTQAPGQTTSTGMGSTTTTPDQIGNTGEDCPDGECRNPGGQCATEVQCFADPCQVSNKCAEGETCTSNYCGGCNPVCTPTDAASGSTLPPLGQTTSTDMITTSTVTDGSETTTMSTTTLGDTETPSTPPSSTTGTTTTTSTTTTATFSIDGNFPTMAPDTPGAPTQVPTTWWQKKDPEDAQGPDNAAPFRSHSFTFYVASTLLVVAITSFFPAGNHLSGYGQFAVFAMAATALYAKKSPAAKKGSIRKSSPIRSLQTCNFNVEILIDGCTHPVVMKSPAGRVIESSLGAIERQQNASDECATDIETEILFPLENSKVMDLAVNNSVPTYDPWGLECARAVAGRPFIDNSGGSLQAIPYFHGGQDDCAASDLSWAGEATVGVGASSTNTTTQFFLGEDWTHRALGEHASVASFSAFSIALMTNKAPSDLVDAALKAGLDEIRHAKISFDIASKLTGKDVGPGPLPESKLEFAHDLKSLALALAREGCLDETLSAFVAAVEVDHIAEVLAGKVQDSPYSNVDPELLVFIKNELANIAMDESNHSVLAWRTLNWVCSLDKAACDAVHNDVFDETALESRFYQRADASFGETASVHQSMRSEWMKVFEAHKNTLSGQSHCKEEDTSSSEMPVVDSVTENIVRQVACS